MHISRSIALLTLIAVTTSFNATAQKKAGASPAASSPAASSPGGAAPAASSGSTAPVEVEWLSYGALDEILQKVADYSCGPDKSAYGKVLILDGPTIQALQAYDTFYQQAKSIEQSLVSMAPQAGAGGGGPDDFADVTGAVSSAAVASNSETSSSFTIQDPTAAIVLLNKLRKQESSACKSAYYAGVYKPDDIRGALVNRDPSSVFGQNLPSVSEELANLATTRVDTLRSIIGQIPATPNTCTATAAAPTATATAVVSTSDPCVNAFNNLDNTYNAFVTALSTPNSTTGQPAASAAIQGYKLRALLQTATVSSPLLGIYLSIAAAGGTQQDRKFLLTNLFTGDWIRYSGGVSVNVIVFSVAGAASQVLFSDLIRYRTPLTKIQAPVPKKDLNAGDNLDEFLPKQASPGGSGDKKTGR